LVVKDLKANNLSSQLMLQSKIALAVFTYSLLSNLPFIFSSLFYSNVQRAFGQAAVLMHTRPCIDLHQNILVFLKHLQLSNDCLVLQGLLLEHEEADYPLLLLKHYYLEWNRLQLA
jgi:hypothetical protein